MYADTNFPTKKALKLAVAAGQRVTLYAPGIGAPKSDGVEFVEGPWYPKPHTWYAKVEVHNNVVVRVE